LFFQIVLQPDFKMKKILLPLLLVLAACADKETTPETTADDYPLTTCVISGSELNDHGEPHVHKHEGRTVKFCCPPCLDDFDKDPAKYLAMIDAAKK